MCYAFPKKSMFDFKKIRSHFLYRIWTAKILKRLNKNRLTGAFSHIYIFLKVNSELNRNSIFWPFLAFFLKSIFESLVFVRAPEDKVADTKIPTSIFLVFSRAAGRINFIKLESIR